MNYRRFMLRVYERTKNGHNILVTYSNPPLIGWVKKEKPKEHENGQITETKTITTLNIQSIRDTQFYFYLRYQNSQNELSSSSWRPSSSSAEETGTTTTTKTYIYQITEIPIPYNNNNTNNSKKRFQCSFVASLGGIIDSPYEITSGGYEDIWRSIANTSAAIYDEDKIGEEEECFFSEDPPYCNSTTERKTHSVVENSQSPVLSTSSFHKRYNFPCTEIPPCREEDENYEANMKRFLLNHNINNNNNCHNKNGITLNFKISKVNHKNTLNVQLSNYCD